MKLTSLKPKLCKVCKQPFELVKPLQLICGWQCAFELIQLNKAKKARKELKAGRDKAKTLTAWLNDAQSAFNAWIRYRDKDKPCISSGRPLTGKFDAGHFRTVKAASQLRFNEDNVHGQTVHDNRDLSGNVLAYRARLIERIGINRVEALENSNETRRYTIPEAKEIIREYKQRLKQAVDN